MSNNLNLSLKLTADPSQLIEARLCKHPSVGGSCTTRPTRQVGARQSRSARLRQLRTKRSPRCHRKPDHPRTHNQPTNTPDTPGLCPASRPKRPARQTGNGRLAARSGRRVRAIRANRKAHLQRPLRPNRLRCRTSLLAYSCDDAHPAKPRIGRTGRARKRRRHAGWNLRCSARNSSLHAGLFDVGPPRNSCRRHATARAYAKLAEFRARTGAHSQCSSRNNRTQKQQSRRGTGNTRPRRRPQRRRRRRHRNKEPATSPMLSKMHTEFPAEPEDRA